MRFFVTFSSLYFPFSGFACTNLLAGKSATTDGSTMITMRQIPICYTVHYTTILPVLILGSMLDIYEWDTGEYLGKIKQVENTYAVIGNMNEHQVSIAESTFGGREELRDSTGILDYGS